MSVIQWRFPSGGDALRSAKGSKAGGRLQVSATSGCLLHGPFLELPPGHCTARVVLAGSAGGQVKMEISAAKGTRVLAKQAFNIASEGGSVLGLTAEIP
jgi:hypothetical protein